MHKFDHYGAVADSSQTSGLPPGLSFDEFKKEWTGTYECQIDEESPIVNVSPTVPNPGMHIPSKECPTYTTESGTCTNITDLPEMSEDGGFIVPENLVEAIDNVNDKLRQEISEKEEQKRREQQLLSDLANMNPKNLENIEYEESE